MFVNRNSRLSILRTVINPLCSLRPRVNKSLKCAGDRMDTRPCSCDQRPESDTAYTCTGCRHRDRNHCPSGADRLIETCQTNGQRHGPPDKRARRRPANRFLLKGLPQLPSAQPTLMREAASGTSRRSWLKSVLAPGAKVRTGAFIVQL